MLKRKSPTLKPDYDRHFENLKKKRIEELQKDISENRLGLNVFESTSNAATLGNRKAEKGSKMAEEKVPPIDFSKLRALGVPSSIKELARATTTTT